MPYIPVEDRTKYSFLVDELYTVLEEHDWHPGHLNYVIYSLLVKHFRANRSYTTANKLMGVLSCVAKEFYRREVVPYEKEKQDIHGDIE